MTTNRPPRAGSARVLPAVWIFVGSFWLAGCGGGNVVPPPPIDPAAARVALQTALEAWQQGDEPAVLRSAEPAIHVADEQWLFGGKLQEFTILDEGDPQGTQVRFRVRLNTVDAGRSAAAAREVAYLVTPGSVLSIIRDDS